MGQSVVNDENLELDYIYTNYTTKEGLPSNEVYCLHQDSKGYIWMGTDRGLVRYDGYEFKTYTTLDGLTDNIILGLNEDNQGNLWYTGLNNVQLGYIDPQMNFHRYTYYEELFESLSKIQHPNIYFNELYIEDSILYLVNSKMGYVKLNPSGIEKIAIKDINMDSKIDTHLFSNGKTKFIYSDPCYSNIQAIHNRILSQDSVIFEYRKSLCVDVEPTWVQSEFNEFIYDGYDVITKDSLGTRHVQVDFKCMAYTIPGGKYIFSVKNKGASKVYISNSPYVFDDKSSLLEDVVVSDVLKDKNGRIWVSTVKNGVFYFPDLTSRRINRDFQVEAIIPFKDKLFFKVNDEETCYNFNYGSKEVKKEFEYLSYSSFENTVKYFNFFGKVRVIDSSRVELNAFASRTFRVKGGQFLSDSLYYLYSPNNFLEVNHGKVNNQYRYIRNKNKGRFDYPQIQVVYCIKEKDCYLGTQDGFYHYNGEELQHLDFERGKSIRDLQYNAQIKAWVYAILGEGLTIRYNDGRIKRITKEDGLASNFINQSFIDSLGHLWLATNRGVSVCQFQNDQIQVETIFNSSKLLNSPNILQIYVRDSILYLGTDAGFNVIDLKSIEENNNSFSPLYLENTHVEGLEDNQPLNQLKYDQNDITFYFSALSYNQFGDIQYRYRLNGLSDQWIYTKERKAIFIGLSPGEYRFELEANNEFGDWISLEELPTFTIAKPYWKSVWFQLLILTTVALIILYYTSNLRREKGLLEDKQVLSDELNESRQMALSSQLNPHFVFNALNSIQNFILTKRTELSSDYLSMFSKLMRFVFENSKKLYVPLSDEMEALRLYLELEQVRHNHMFKYKIESIDLDAEQIFIPSLMVQPLIENAIWHGLLHKKEDDRLLEVLFYAQGEFLCIHVKDNGVGRGQSKPRPKFIKKQKSSGVELTQQRLDLLSQSTGLSTSFEVVDLVDDDHNPKGTLVKIAIPLNLKMD